MRVLSRAPSARPRGSVFVAGEAGVGKTALLHAFRDTIARTRRTLESACDPLDVAWIRSYVLDERDGTVDTCASTGPRARRPFAHMRPLPTCPVDEIVKVADPIVVRPDPAAVAA
jgi:predicted ATPase